MAKRCTTLSTEIVHENPRWIYKHDEVQFSDGVASSYYYGEKIGGAIAVPLLDDGRLLLVRQYRYLRDTFSVEFPRGAMNTDETPAATAQREFFEETGYTAGEMTSIGSFEPINGLLRNTLHIFLATDLSKKADQHLDEGELVEIIYRRVDEFEDMIRRGEISDGVTLAAWALAREQVHKLIVA